MNNKFQNNIFMHKIIPRKQRLFITKTYNSNMNYQKGPLLNVINDYYFCTKGIGKINVYNNKNREFDEINNKNKNKSNSNKKTKYRNNSNKNIIKNNNYTYKEYDSDKNDAFLKENEFIKEKNDYKKRKENNEEIIDNENNKKIIDNENNKKIIDNENNKKINKIKSKEEKKEPEMWTELDLDKNRNPSKIRIKIHNPFYPLYQFNQKDNNQIISLNKLRKSRSNFFDNNIHINKGSNSNQNLIRINNKKNLGPLKLKRRTKTNSTSSVYTTKSDNIGFASDYNYNYNYFNNREIANAIGNRIGRNCEACNSVKNKNKHYSNNNKFNTKSFESGFKKNNLINEEKIKKIKKRSNDNKNNYNSHNKNKKAKNKRGSKGKNQSNVSNSSLSSKYANVINIEFPALSSYFH